MCLFIYKAIEQWATFSLSEQATEQDGAKGLRQYTWKLQWNA